MTNPIGKSESSSLKKTLTSLVPTRELKDIRYEDDLVYDARRRSKTSRIIKGLKDVCSSVEYYYDKTTGLSSWTIPKVDSRENSNQSSLKRNDNDVWIRMKDQLGREFQYNTTTCESKWIENGGSNQDGALTESSLYKLSLRPRPVYILRDERGERDYIYDRRTGQSDFVFDPREDSVLGLVSEKDRLDDSADDTEEDQVDKGKDANYDDEGLLDEDTLSESGNSAIDVDDIDIGPLLEALLPLRAIHEQEKLFDDWPDINSFLKLFKQPHYHWLALMIIHQVVVRDHGEFRRWRTMSTRSNDLRRIREIWLSHLYNTITSWCDKPSEFYQKLSDQLNSILKPVQYHDGQRSSLGRFECPFRLSSMRKDTRPLYSQLPTSIRINIFLSMVKWGYLKGSFFMKEALLGEDAGNIRRAFVVGLENEEDVMVKRILWFPSLDVYRLFLEDEQSGRPRTISDSLEGVASVVERYCNSSSTPFSTKIRLIQLLTRLDASLALMLLDTKRIVDPYEQKSQSNSTQPRNDMKESHGDSSTDYFEGEHAVSSFEPITWNKASRTNHQTGSDSTEMLTRMAVGMSEQPAQARISLQQNQSDSNHPNWSTNSSRPFPPVSLTGYQSLQVMNNDNSRRFPSRSVSGILPSQPSSSAFSSVTQQQRRSPIVSGSIPITTIPRVISLDHQSHTPDLPQVPLNPGASSINPQIIPPFQCHLDTGVSDYPANANDAGNQAYARRFVPFVAPPFPSTQPIQANVDNVTPIERESNFSQRMTLNQPRSEIFKQSFDDTNAEHGIKSLKQLKQQESPILAPTTTTTIYTPFLPSPPSSSSTTKGPSQDFSLPSTSSSSPNSSPRTHQMKSQNGHMEPPSSFSSKNSSPPVISQLFQIDGPLLSNPSPDISPTRSQIEENRIAKGIQQSKELSETVLQEVVLKQTDSKTTTSLTENPSFANVNVGLSPLNAERNKNDMSFERLASTTTHIVESLVLGHQQSVEPSMILSKSALSSSNVSGIPQMDATTPQVIPQMDVSTTNKTSTSTSPGGRNAINTDTSSSKSVTSTTLQGLAQPNLYASSADSTNKREQQILAMNLQGRSSHDDDNGTFGFGVVVPSPAALRRDLFSQYGEFTQANPSSDEDLSSNNVPSASSLLTTVPQPIKEGQEPKLGESSAKIDEINNAVASHPTNASNEREQTSSTSKRLRTSDDSSSLNETNQDMNGNSLTKGRIEDVTRIDSRNDEMSKKQIDVQLPSSDHNKDMESHEGNKDQVEDDDQEEEEDGNNEDDEEDKALVGMTRILLTQAESISQGQSEQSIGDAFEQISNQNVQKDERNLKAEKRKLKRRRLKNLASTTSTN